MNNSFAWALIRVTAGLSLAYAHGLPKLQRGVESFAAGVANLGFPAPLFFAWCATLTELVGGVLLALGLLTRPMGALAAFTMAVALFQHRADPFRSMELPLLYFMIFVGAALGGSGRYGLDTHVKLPGILGRLQR